MFFDKGPICMYDIINFTQLTYSACLCQFEDISARKKLADSPEYPKGMGGKNIVGRRLLARIRKVGIQIAL